MVDRLRKVGFTLDMTDADVRDIVGRSLAFSKRTGGGIGGYVGGTAFSEGGAQTKWDIAGQSLRAASNFSEVREAAKAFQGKPLKSADGVNATVSRGNLDKMLSASAVHKSESAVEHAMAVANLDTLFAQSVTGWTKTDREGDPEITAIRRLFAPMRIGDKARLVKLTVKEFTRHGNRIYSVEAVSVEEGSPVPEMVDADRTNGSRLLTGPTGLIDSLVEQINEFNRGASFSRDYSVHLSDAQQADPALTGFLGKIGAELPPSMLDKAKASYGRAKSAPKSYFADKVSLARQAVIDQYESLRQIDMQLMGQDFLDKGRHEASGWVLARMAKSAEGALEALWMDGVPYLDGKSINVDTAGQGLASVFKNRDGRHHGNSLWLEITSST